MARWGEIKEESRGGRSMKEGMLYRGKGAVGQKWRRRVVQHGNRMEGRDGAGEVVNEADGSAGPEQPWPRRRAWVGIFETRLAAWTDRQTDSFDARRTTHDTRPHTRTLFEPLYVLWIREESAYVSSSAEPADHVVRWPDAHHCGAEGGYVVRAPAAGMSAAAEQEADSTQGTDQSQGRGQVLSNINACLAVQSTIKGTLGPYGGDLLMVDENGRQTITNDGATVMKVYKQPASLSGRGSNVR